MTLKVGKSNGRTYLSIVHGYRDYETKKVRTKTIRSLGYLEDLQKEYSDPIAHFREVAAEMEKKRLCEEKPQSIDINLSEKLEVGTDNRKNYGYAALSCIYHELGLHTFFANRTRHMQVEYDINSIMKLLVYERLLNPGSKKRTYENRGNYFDTMDFSLADVYRSLSHIKKFEESLQLWIHERITETQGRNMEHMYYDVTNYYFEIDEPDDMRKKGVSKEHRPNPIIQMGLFMDSNGLPVSYELFPGNTNDCETLIPTLKRLKRDYDTGRIIVVADKGMSTADNCYYNIHTLKNGYVFSRTVRGADQEMKKYVLDDKGYEVTKNEAGEVKFKIKSRLYPRQVEVEGDEKKKVKRVLDEKQVVFYSLDYDKKAKADRANAVEKARSFAKNPEKYKNATNRGAAKYIKNIEYDKKTGEVILTGKTPTFDEAKLKEEEKYDGYYVIVTSEYKKTDDEIITIYRGLWQIEETFRVTKSDLETRPVYVTREDRIRAHFLTCFVALVIVRLLQQKLGHQYSVARLVESLSKLSCSHIKENYYLFDYADEITEAAGKALGIDFGKKFMTLKDIKTNLAATKK